jgi:predicted Zn-dependent protease
LSGGRAELCCHADDALAECAILTCSCRLHAHPILSRRAALGLGLGTAVAGCSEFGQLGAGLVDPDQVQQMGLSAFQEIKQETPISRNPQANALVERVGRRVVAASGSDIPAAQWEFVVFDSDQLNAFALPGGKVGVYSGMLNLIGGDEAELATVIGHEIGHVTANHAAQRVGTSQITSLGGTVLAVVLEAYGVPMGQQATGLAAEYLVARPFSRSQELDADRLGFTYMAEAGYDPAQAIEFWQKMARAGSGSGPGFLSTHPADAERMAQLEALLPEAQRIYRSGAG